MGTAEGYRGTCEASWNGETVSFVLAKEDGQPQEKEEHPVCVKGLSFTLDKEEAGDNWTFSSNLKELLGDCAGPLVTTGDLGEAFEPEMRFENPDGSPITFDTDYNGKTATSRIPGPFC